MSYCIIIRGPLGVGKTTVGQALEKRLDANYISIDGVMETNDLDKVEDENIPVRNFILATELTLTQVQTALSAG